MPFRSESQRRWMWANDPKMAQRWADHTPKGTKLPKHVSDEEEKEKKAEDDKTISNGVAKFLFGNNYQKDIERGVENFQHDLEDKYCSIFAEGAQNERELNGITGSNQHNDWNNLIPMLGVGAAGVALPLLAQRFLLKSKNSNKNQSDKLSKRAAEIKHTAHFEGFCDRAAEFGLDKQASEEMYKLARPLGDIPEGPGPDMMLQALNQLASARAMVRPTEDTLDTYGLSRGGFQSSLKRIIDKTQDEEKYNLSDNAPDPRVQGGVGAALGALAGLGVNKATGNSDILHNLLYAGGGALLGGLAGAGKGALERRNYGQTAKLLKQYGMLDPQLLRQAYPLLADEYSFK